MEILKTTGIALSSQALGEADIICNFYTRDCGKRRFLFKGLKKSKKRSLAATEPGSMSTLVYYQRDDRDYCIVNEITVEKYYTAITADLNKIWHLYFLLESVDKTSGFDMGDESIFKLLSAGIEVLSKTEFPAHLSAFMILHLLQLHGILSDLDFCKLCGTKQFSTFAMDVTDLRPVCGACLGAASSGHWRGSTVLPGAMREYMVLCMSQKFNAIDHGRFSEKDLLDLLFAISLFMEHYFHMEIKSKSFIFSDRLNR
ncbi:MAG: DNA repair protein RecO [Spirochaetes bacterium]|nr:DNA repair protein RecO [Spirochaetota bacterium]